MQNRPYMPAPPPPEMVDRREEYRLIMDALTAVKQGGMVGITAALRGAGGYGKTTLARAVCKDLYEQGAFPDGFYWVTLGEMPSSAGTADIGKMQDVARFMGEEWPGFSEVGAASAYLRQVLKDKDALLVIDDAWSYDRLELFLQPESQTTVLITTRNDDVLPPEAYKVKVDRMREDESVALICYKLPVGEEQELRDLASRLGHWPLLLRLVNGQIHGYIREGYSLAEALQLVNDAYEEEGLTAFNDLNSTDRNRAADKAIKISIDALKPEQQDRLLELGVFPEDVDIPLNVVELLWKSTQGLTSRQTGQLCTLFSGRSLLSEFDARGKTIRLHDMIRKYLIERLRKEGKFQKLHHTLVEGYWEQCSSSWASGPEDGYYFHWLAYHLAQGEEWAELGDLLLDFDWMQARLKHGGIHELLGDYEQGKREECQQLVQRALRMSAHVLAQDPDQLAEQLLGRLLGFKNVKIQALLNNAGQKCARPSMLPLSPCFTPPGSGLIQTLAGHTHEVTAVAITPDSRLAVSASWDNTLKVWDLETGKQRHTLKGHTS